jgi:uncharacterized protein (TIGR03067 family)
MRLARLRLALSAALLFGLSTIVAAADPKDEAVKNELKVLQDTWDAQSSMENGVELPVPPEGVKMVLKDGKYALKQGSRDLGGGTLTVDPTKTPKTMDLSEGDKNPQTYPCIYEVKGDILRIARAQPGEARPKDFSGKGSRVFVFRRSKT